MSRYRREDFEAAGLTPGECDGAEYPGTPDNYWFTCDYHAGYIDGHEAASVETRAVVGGEYTRVTATSAAVVVGELAFNAATRMPNHYHEKSYSNACYDPNCPVRLGEKEGK